jgi:hypothetical protein
MNKFEKQILDAIISQTSIPFMLVPELQSSEDKDLSNFELEFKKLVQDLAPCLICGTITLGSELNTEHCICNKCLAQIINKYLFPDLEDERAKGNSIEEFYLPQINKLITSLSKETYCEAKALILKLKLDCEALLGDQL